MDIVYIDEIPAIKRRLAAKFDNDLHRIAADVRKRQGHTTPEVISLSPRRCTPTPTNAVNRRIRRNITAMSLDPWILPAGLFLVCCTHAIYPQGL